MLSWQIGGGEAEGEFGGGHDTWTSTSPSSPSTWQKIRRSLANNINISNTNKKQLNDSHSEVKRVWLSHDDDLEGKKLSLKRPLPTHARTLVNLWRISSTTSASLARPKGQWVSRVPTPSPKLQVNCTLSSTRGYSWPHQWLEETPHSNSLHFCWSCKPKPTTQPTI